MAVVAVTSWLDLIDSDNPLGPAGPDIAASLSASWVAALDGWRAWCVAAGHSVRTIALRRWHLERFAAGKPDPWQATTPDLVSYLAVTSWSADTRKSARSALRSFYSWAAENRHVRVDPSARLPKVRVPPGLPRPCPEDALSEALRAADDRVRLMLLLGAYAGLRAAETASLRWADIDTDTLRVTGKGGKTRIVPLHPVLAAELSAERTRRALGRFGSGWRYGSAASGFVFPSQTAGLHATAGNVIKTVHRALGRGSHTLRHRFGQRVYDTTGDLLATQQLLGHSKPETTTVYARASAASLARAVNGI